MRYHGLKYYRFLDENVHVFLLTFGYERRHTLANRYKKKEISDSNSARAPKIKCSKNNKTNLCKDASAVSAYHVAITIMLKKIRWLTIWAWKIEVLMGYIQDKYQDVSHLFSHTQWKNMWRCAHQVLLPYLGLVPVPLLLTWNATACAGVGEHCELF